jgi:dienelactone hydrolase
VLRYDKRSCFHETVPACKNSVFDYPGDPTAIVLDDFVADARAAARYVSDRPEVRDQGIVAVGHSEGGVLATALVEAAGPVGSAVLLGAPALPFEDTAAGQLESYADYLQGLGDAYQNEVDELHDKAARWRSELDQIRQGTYPKELWEGASVSYVRSTLSWYDTIDERFTALERPVLVLSGLADFNVGPAHLEHYETLAAEHYQHNVSTHALPDVTHAFCVKPDSSAWAPFEPDLAPEARQRLLSWLGAADPQLTL